MEGELYTSLAHSEIFPINHGRLPVENRRGKIRISARAIPAKEQLRQSRLNRQSREEETRFENVEYS